MIPTGSIQSPDRPWRAASAGVADGLATRPEWYAAANRRDTVRTALQVLLTKPDAAGNRESRRAHVRGLLADSVEKQARILGLGRDIHIPRDVVA